MKWVLKALFIQKTLTNNFASKIFINWALYCH